MFAHQSVVRRHRDDRIAFPNHLFLADATFRNPNEVFKSKSVGFEIVYPHNRDVAVLRDGCGIVALGRRRREVVYTTNQAAR